MATILISMVLLRVQLHLANSSEYKRELYCLSQGIRSLALLEILPQIVPGKLSAWIMATSIYNYGRISKSQFLVCELLYNGQVATVADIIRRLPHRFSLVWC